MRAVLMVCVAALFAGCSAAPVEQPAAPTLDQAAPAAKPKIEQAGFSTIRRFEICTGNDCSKRTEKIIDVPEPPSVPPPAVAEAVEAPPPVKDAVPVVIAPPAPVLHAVAFAGNRATPSKEGLAAIKSLLPAAKSARKVVVRGYADADDSAKRLALRRANAVKRLLVKGGVKANVVAVATERPDADTKNSGCAANQHVTIELINKE